MEMRLKERLVGAIVLVLAAVIFIPMLLDGPGRDRQISHRVPLPDSSERRTVRIDLASGENSAGDAPAREQDSGDPVSVDLTPAQDAAAVEPVSEPPRVEDTSGSSSSSRIAASAPIDSEDSDASADSPWTVQAGAFGRRENADALADKLKQIDYAAYVSEFKDSGGTHYRVRVGGFESREEAQAKADEIGERTGEPARPARTD